MRDYTREFHVMECPLCLSDGVIRVQHKYRKNVIYWHCGHCDLIFLDKNDHLDEAEEKKRYLNHENDIANVGYIEFLQPTIDKIKNLFTNRKNAYGLDFGCGPNPVLAQVLRREGFRVDTYDFYFANNSLSNRYDFIVSTEVFEHFRDPLREILKIKEILNGPLVVLTQLHQGVNHFTDWYYPRDPTHVVFYSQQTMSWLEKKFSLDLHIVYNRQK